MTKFEMVTRICLARMLVCVGALCVAVISCSADKPDPWTEYKNGELARFAQEGQPESFYSMYEGNLGPMKIQLKTWMLGENLFRIDSDMGVFKVAMGFDGKDAWVKMGDQPARPLSKAEEADIFSSLYFDGLEYLSDPDLKVSVPQADLWDGRKVWEVGLESPDGYRRDLFIQDGNWELVGYRSYGTTTALAKMFECEWREGMQIPHRVVMEMAGLGMALNLNLVTADVNSEIAPDIFIPESGKITPLDIAGNKKQIGISMVHRETDMILLPGKIGGQDGTFLLDSGAAHSVLDSTAAKDIKFADEDLFTTIGVGGAQESRVVKGSGAMSLGRSGEVQLPGDSIFIVMDLGGISKEMGVNLAGIAGADILVRSKVELDFIKQIVTFRPYTPEEINNSQSTGNETPEKVNKSAITVPLIRLGELVLVEGESGERKKVSLLVDTGFRGEIGLLPGGAKKLELSVARGRGKGVVSGIGGVSEIKGLVGKLHFSLFGEDWNVENVPIIAGPVASLVGGSADGLVGILLLSRMHLEFDYMNGVIRILD